jgi:hypothetical protein
LDRKVQEKELEVKAKETETQKLETALNQTEVDLANAVLVIQEKESKVTELESERDQAIAVVTELINEIPPDPVPKPKSIVPNLALTDNDADNTPTSTASSQAGFGTKFPANPQKGDMFLRVDMLPNKLFKWNGQKWIEVAKSTTDRYAYEEEYIKYITDKIISGEYDMDDLSKAEQEEVLLRLTHDQKRRL